MRGVGARGGEGAGPPSSVLLRPCACAQLICRAFRVASNAARPAAHAALLPPALCEQVPLVAARPAAARSSALSQSIVAKAAAAAAPEAATEAVAHLRFVRGSPLKVCAVSSAQRRAIRPALGRAYCSRLGIYQVSQLWRSSLCRASNNCCTRRKGGPGSTAGAIARPGLPRRPAVHECFSSWRVWRHPRCPAVCRI